MHPFTIALVAGVTPDRWVRTWAERHPERPLSVTVVEDPDQTEVLWDASADMAFVRLPVDTAGLHVIPLYEEQSVVVLPRDHPFAEEPRLTLADLAEEHLIGDVDAVPGWAETAAEVRDGSRLDLPAMTLRQQVEVVASGTGIVVVPRSLARVHHRKDVVPVPLEDGPTSRVGLAWRTDNHDPGIEDFIGIVRGRTVNSSRGATPAPAARASTTSAAARKPRPTPRRGARKGGSGRGGSGRRR